MKIAATTARRPLCRALLAGALNGPGQRAARQELPRLALCVPSAVFSVEDKDKDRTNWGVIPGGGPMLVSARAPAPTGPVDPGLLARPRLAPADASLLGSGGPVAPSVAGEPGTEIDIQPSPRSSPSSVSLF